ncbi:replication protein A 70 kDa DNA-binding subunit B-like [Lycium ferocissimum]|uniref:replication protein A 70 kDa DNA-binding subunit B-like n=1 Tax=Lycium ferocissimum TaxID=112874 RepID=UPI002815EFCB|nr:replication protein A 70 kDa DNA-binding subunit B-like [Lycium ferocissimum]
MKEVSSGGMRRRESGRERHLYWYDRRTVTLWGELAEKDGEILQKLIDTKPVVAFCDVKGSTYQGNISKTLFTFTINSLSITSLLNFILCVVRISTTHISSVLINPTFQKANKLQNWHDCLKAQNKDITLMPTKMIREAKEVKIKDIINGSYATMKDLYCRFNARVTLIIDKDEPWYSSCKKCYKKVNIENKIANCSNCRSESVDYEES